MSTIQMLPHLANAVRSRKPGGSPVGWTLSFFGSTLWAAYGIAIGDLLVAAPGVVTVPVSLVMAAWAWHATMATSEATREVADVADVSHLPVGVPMQRAVRMDDTLELPIFAAA